MARSRGTNAAQFTYDFGIAIAQSTVSKLTRLTGATLTLASAYYALRETANKYLSVLRENELRFGGMVSAMKAIEQAQDRIVKGQSYFSVDDQLRGMNKLMAAGVEVGKNLDWINKAAHATGKSFEEFSGMISSAIQGNMSQLVDAGLMTQRATRLFDKYAANTVMRQQAILNFVKSHKGLMAAIKNDFFTIQDQMTRIKSIWGGFLHSIIGKPNDPGSFYGQIVSSMKLVADALARNMESLKRYGFIIGQILSWVVKQIGHFVVWVGRQVKKALESVWTVTDDFANQARSIVVWLEFWKVRIVDFFHEYSGLIKNVLKLMLAFQALKYVFVIGRAAIASVMAYRAAILGTIALQRRYIASMGPYIGRAAKWFQSLAVWLPKPFRGAWVSMGKFFADFKVNMAMIGRNILRFFIAPFRLAGKSVMFVLRLLRNLPSLVMAAVRGLKALWVALNATNPVGWIILAITLLGVIYAKCRSFRVLVNNTFKIIWESLKLIYNLIVGLVVYTIVGIKRVWRWFVDKIFTPIASFFSAVFGWIGDMWKKFMNTAVGRWINDHIVEPIKNCFDWIVKAWKWVIKAVANVLNYLGMANTKLGKNINELAKSEGIGGLAIATEGGEHDTQDDTNYMNPMNWLKGAKGENSDAGTGNPLLADASASMQQNPASSSTSSNTSMNFGNGAIQIIVEKGEGIDERVLAQKVRGILNDMKREGNMRGGTI